MAPHAGQVIGPYEIGVLLGKGGMGEVYRARDTRLPRQVAIKFLSGSLHHDPNAAARLEQEARLASSLNHPGIVTVLDVGRWDGRPYIVMELVEGQSLADLMASGRLALREALDVALQVAEALAAAHDAGIFHRDLKPQNVMIVGDGRAKLIDFGLGKKALPAIAADGTTLTAALTLGPALMGTVGYLAPEQVAGREVSGAADQFALGVVLYEMLSGQRAFNADTPVQTLSSILEAEPRPLSDLRPELPAQAVAVVRRCLAKRPERRYASTHDLVSDLRDLRDALVADSRPLTRRWSPAIATRRPARIGRVVAWVVAVAITTAAAWWTMPTPPPADAVPPPAPRQIVILPFQNITKVPEDQVFAEGLMETLASSLTQLERFDRTLRVVPASEVRGRVATAREAHQNLGATLVISGSIQRRGSTLQMTLNLIDAAQLVQVSSRSLEMVTGEESATEDAVVDATTALLALELDPIERRALTAGGSAVPAAYQWFVQGRGYLQRFDRGPQNVDRAIDALNRAVEGDPRYALAHAALGEAYWRKYEVDRRISWIETATRHGERALAIDNRLAPIHVTLALIARGRGRYEEAVTFAQRALELDPVSSEAFRELGRAYEELQRLAEAEVTYGKAVNARPSDWLAYNTLGSFYLARGRWADAERAFRQVTVLTPDNTRGYNNLGVTYFRMGREDEAAAMWERSSTIRSTLAAASNLGSYYYARARYPEAARAFERATILAPSDYRAWRNLGSALHWAPGERAQAADAYRRAVVLMEGELKVNPRQATVTAAMADAYAMLGERTKARDAIAAAERTGVADGESLFVLAGASEQVRERAAALAFLERAIAAGYSRDAIARSPTFAGLREDERYARLMNGRR